MIRKDEMTPSRRRRFHELYTTYHDSSKLPYPAGTSSILVWFSLRRLRWSECHPVLDRSFARLTRRLALPRLHPGRLVAPEPFWASQPSRRRGAHTRRHQSELYGT